MSTPSTTRSKDNYKVRNRKVYNSSLCKRGSLNLWLEDSVLREWESLTGNGEDDASVGGGMLKNRTSRVGRFSGDGAYDKFDFREVLGTEVVQIIPPPKNAVVQKAKRNKPLPDYLRQRNLAVEYIRRHGPKSWKEKQGYHRRSLNEVAMFRYKTIFGGELDARLMENQVNEARLKCLILNKYTGIGMPDSCKAS